MRLFGFGGGAAKGGGGQAGVSPSEDALRSFDLDPDQDINEQIVASLKRQPGMRRAVAGQTAPAFRNIVAQTQKRLNGDDLKRLNIHLAHAFPDDAHNFRVFGVEQPSLGVRPEPKAWVGRGVFCPNPGEAPVARIELSGVDPAHRRAPPAAPELGRGHPAGWYEGQRGLAFGFSAGSAPSTVSLTDLAGNFGGALDDVIISLDIHDLGQAMTVSAYRRDGSGTESVPLTPLRGGGKPGGEPSEHLFSGEWEQFQIAGKSLWMRFADFAPFIPTSGAAGQRSAAAGPRLRVIGFLLPELRGRMAWNQRRPKSWRVDFDHVGRLRASELRSLAHTAYSRYGGFSVYSHLERQYDKESPDGRRVHDIGGGRRVIEAGFDHNLINASFRRLALLSGKRSSIVGLNEPGETLLAPFGDIPLGPALPDGKLRKWRLSAAPLEPESHDTALRLGEGALSLDWVNRAAKVEADKWMGLAEFCLRNASLVLTVAHSDPQDAAPAARASLTAEATLPGKRGVIKAVANPGDYLVLGPLLAQFIVED